MPEVRVLDRAGRQVVVQPGDHPQRGLVAVQRALHPHGVGAVAVDELAPRPLGRLGSGGVHRLGDRQHGLVVAAHADVGVGELAPPGVDLPVGDAEVPHGHVVGQAERRRRVGERLAHRVRARPQRRLGGDGVLQVPPRRIDPRVREELGSLGHIHWQHRSQSPLRPPASVRPPSCRWRTAPRSPPRRARPRRGPPGCARRTGERGA